MLFDYLLKKHYTRIEHLEQARRWNHMLIIKEQAELKKDIAKELGTGKGLLLSFTAGCVTGIAAGERDRLALLKRTATTQIAAFASLLK